MAFLTRWRRQRYGSCLSRGEESIYCARMGGTLPSRWIHGSPHCSANTDPAVQVHTFDDNTFILRQNKCFNYEAPFLYLLFGTEKALLLDTGARPQPCQELRLRDVVQEIIGRWRTAHAQSAIELIVAHSHSHGDHSFADDQFDQQPATTVVQQSLDEMRDFFGFRRWPGQAVTFDLGGRPLTVLAVPGHEESHIAFHDARTGILLSGDAVYPGPVCRQLERLSSEHQTTGTLCRRSCGQPHPRCSHRDDPHQRRRLSVRRNLSARRARSPAVERTPASTGRRAHSLGPTPTRLVMDDFIIEPLGA